MVTLFFIEVKTTTTDANTALATTVYCILSSLFMLMLIYWNFLS